MNKKFLALLSTVLVTIGLFAGESQAQDCEGTKVDHCHDVQTNTNKRSAFCRNYYMVVDNEGIICQKSRSIDWDCSPVMTNKKTCELK